MAPDARKKLEQIRASKKKKAITKVGDLRQLIKKKTPNTTSSRESERINKNGLTTIRSRPTSSGGGPRDLRNSNRRLAARRTASQTRDVQTTTRYTRTTNPVILARATNLVKRTVNVSGQGRIDKRYPEMQHYVPPHVQRSNPTYIIAPPTSSKPKSVVHTTNRAGDTQGASILVSNLPPSITQSDIIQLFCEIGDMIAVNLINPTTALVTYQNANDAVRAVKIYHSRLLDDKPMIVNMMPNTS